MYNLAIESVLECMECFLYRIHTMCSLYNVIYKNSRVIYKKLPQGHKIKKNRNSVWRETNVCSSEIQSNVPITPKTARPRHSVAEMHRPISTFHRLGRLLQFGAVANPCSARSRKHPLHSEKHNWRTAAHIKYR